MLFEITWKSQRKMFAFFFSLILCKELDTFYIRDKYSNPKYCEEFYELILKAI